MSRRRRTWTVIPRTRYRWPGISIRQASYSAAGHHERRGRGPAEAGHYALRRTLRTYRVTESACGAQLRDGPIGDQQQQTRDAVVDPHRDESVALCEEEDGEAQTDRDPHPVRPPV